MLADRRSALVLGICALLGMTAVTQADESPKVGFRYERRANFHDVYVVNNSNRTAIVTVKQTRYPAIGDRTSSVKEYRLLAGGREFVGYDWQQNTKFSYAITSSRFE